MLGQFKLISAFIFGLIIASVLWKISLDFVSDKPVPDAIFSSSIIDKKEEVLIENKTSKKIVIIGGSNVAFGIDSIKIENEFGIKAINFGCMAGIGPEILLSKINQHITSGDIVLFCWEYGLYRFKRTSTNFTYLNLIFGPYSDFRLNYSLIDRTRLSLTYPTSHLRDSIVVAYNSFVNTDIYKCPWFFDEYGNVRSNQEQIIQKQELINSPLSPLMKELTITDVVAESLTNFVHSSGDKNIQILSTWPNTFKHPKYFNNGNVEKNFSTINRFWQDLNVPMISTPKDSMFSAEFFHDTGYHLNTEGVRIRTEKLIENLKLYLNEYF